MIAWLALCFLYVFFSFLIVYLQDRAAIKRELKQFDIDTLRMLNEEKK